MFFRNFFKPLKTLKNTQVLFFKVKCSGCGEVVKVRVNTLRRS